MTTIPTFSDLDIYILDDITFIGGTYKNLEFYLFEGNNNFIIPRRIKVLWELSDYNLSGNVVLSKNMSIAFDYRIPIEILSSETENLQGRYIQTLSMNIGGDYTVVLAKGIVNILPAIKE